MPSENVVETDVLVIGGGIAGCYAAIKAREQGLDVTIVDKAYAGKSGASISASVGWMAFNPEWDLDYDACMNAFNKEGEYINNREWGKVILNESWTTYRDLISWGCEVPSVPLEFIKRLPPFPNASLQFRAQTPVLRKQAGKVGVRIMDRIMVTDLLKHEGKVMGAIGFPMESFDLYIFKAKATVLCGGGNSFKPAGFPISMQTGDAEAMAYRAGAEITGKEFLSTHPTKALYPAALFAFKLSQGGAYSYYFTDATNQKHVSFIGGGETGTRGEPDLSMEFLIHDGKGPLCFDPNISPPEHVAAIFSTVKKQFDSKKITHGGKTPVAGGAAAGYQNAGTAGIWIIDTNGTTTLPGLYAAGDCGGTRYNGAFNSTPGLGTGPASVTGRRAGGGAAEYALQSKKPVTDNNVLEELKKIVYGPAERKGGFSPRWATQLLQNTMIPYFISYIKHGDRLQAALTYVEFLKDQIVPKLKAGDTHELRLAHETRNMTLNAEMILRASLLRTESRGTHFRQDYPRRNDPSWLAWTKVREEQGRMIVSKEPIPREWWPDLSKPYEERYPSAFPGE